jgi:hypothetical protein
MSHNLRPRKQENLLEKEKPAASHFSLLRFLVKLSVGCFLLGVSQYQGLCEDDISDLVEISYILILVECGFLAVYLLGKYFPDSCLTFVSYYLACYIFTDFLVDLFYLIWGIYFFIVYANEDHCKDQSNLSYAAKVTTLVYLIVFNFFIFCSCGTKVCMTFGTCCTAADTNRNSLSEKLLSKDEEGTVKENKEDTQTAEKKKEKKEKGEKKDKKGEKKEKKSKKEKNEDE